MIVSNKELMLITKWDEFEMGICRLEVQFFNQYIPFVLFQEHRPKPNISKGMIKSINDILALHEVEQSFFQQEFSKELGYKVKEIHIDQDNDAFESVYSEIMMERVTGETVQLIVKDGKIICYNPDGSYFDSIEEV